MRIMLHPDLEHFFAHWNLLCQPDGSFKRMLGDRSLAIVVKVKEDPAEGGTIYSIRPELYTDRFAGQPLVRTNSVTVKFRKPWRAEGFKPWKPALLQELRRLLEISKYLPQCSCGPRSFSRGPNSIAWTCLRQRCPALPSKDLLFIGVPKIQEVLAKTKVARIS